MDQPPGPAGGFYPKPIELGSLRREAVNVRDVGESAAVVVIPSGDKLYVLREVCPHTGGPLSEASFCRKDKTLQCPWHGYIFSLETGALQLNPNERIMAPLRQPSACFKPERAPKYSLAFLSYKIVGDKAYVRRQGSAE